MTLIYHTEFPNDLNQAVTYYNTEREGLGNDLQKEVEAAIVQIVRNPVLYGTVYGNVRQLRLRRFKWYAVRYRVLDDGTIRILSLLHGARHPDTAIDRI